VRTGDGALTITFELPPGAEGAQGAPAAPAAPVPAAARFTG